MKQNKNKKNEPTWSKNQLKLIECKNKIKAKTK